MNTADLIWMNGEFVSWEDAKVHVLTHSLHYGTGVFEGIRAYETDRGTAIFRHQDHLDRLRRSAAMYYMDMPFQLEKLREVTHELIVRNGFRSCYIRPLVYRGHGPMGLNPLAMFGSVAMMLRYGLGMEAEAAGIESAIDRALENGLRTPDLGGNATTEDATKAVLSHL